MVLIDYVDPETATGRARELLETDAEYYDRPSLFARVMANSPQVFDARTEYHRALVEGGEIENRILELVYLAVSVTNDCEYCIASHREVLVEQVGLPSGDVEALARGDLEGFDERERAAVEFARAVARDPKLVDEDDVDALHDAGFDEAAVIRLLTTATAAIAANAIADALDVHPSDREEPFAK